MSFTLLALAAAALVVLLSAPASAQNIEGTTQLGLELGLLSFSRTTTDPDTGGVDDIETTITSFGTLDSSTLTLGYGISNHFVIGVGVSASIETQSQDETDDLTSTAFSLAPSATYVFAGSTLRPFVGAGIGIARISVDSGDIETSSTVFGLTGSVGVHWFAAEAVSVSPTLGLGYAFGSASVENAGFDAEGDIGVFGVELGLALTAWL